jgi:hypothetical protein
MNSFANLVQINVVWLVGLDWIFGFWFRCYRFRVGV